MIIQGVVMPVLRAGWLPGLPISEREREKPGGRAGEGWPSGPDSPGHTLRAREGQGRVIPNTSHCHTVTPSHGILTQTQTNNIIYSLQ